jgi:16S rRNA (guanine527-N7)-methyltransferase
MNGRNEFISGIIANQTAFHVDLSAKTIEWLADYLELVLEHNPILHLVSPASIEEFAVRHVLESLTLLDLLPQDAKFADVGPGAGLPSIPCLLAREDLKAVLIESKIKKARFLTWTITKLDLEGRAAVINRQFEETDAGNCRFVTCRALDKFAERLPRLLKWAGGRNLFLFGGPNLADALERNGRRFDQSLLPLSERRYLFSVDSGVV